MSPGRRTRGWPPHWFWFRRIRRSPICDPRLANANDPYRAPSHGASSPTWLANGDNGVDRAAQSREFRHEDHPFRSYRPLSPWQRCGAGERGLGHEEILGEPGEQPGRRQLSSPLLGISPRAVTHVGLFIPQPITHSLERKSSCMPQKERRSRTPGRRCEARPRSRRARGIGVILAGEAPAHRNQFTLSGRLQPHDIGKVHRGGDDDLIRSILDLPVSMKYGHAHRILNRATSAAFTSAPRCLISVTDATNVHGYLPSLSCSMSRPRSRRRWLCGSKSVRR